MNQQTAAYAMLAIRHAQDSEEFLAEAGTFGMEQCDKFLDQLADMFPNLRDFLDGLYD